MRVMNIGFGINHTRSLFCVVVFLTFGLSRAECDVLYNPDISPASVPVKLIGTKYDRQHFIGEQMEIPSATSSVEQRRRLADQWRQRYCGFWISPLESDLPEDVRSDIPAGTFIVSVTGDNLEPFTSFIWCEIIGAASEYRWVSLAQVDLLCYRRIANASEVQTVMRTLWNQSVSPKTGMRFEPSFSSETKELCRRINQNSQLFDEVLTIVGSRLPDMCIIDMYIHKRDVLW